MKWTTIIFMALMMPVGWAQPSFPVLYTHTEIEYAERSTVNPVDDFAAIHIPFELSGGLIIVKGVIDGEQGQFVFDTGSPSMLVNKPLAGGVSNSYIIGLGRAQEVQKIKINEFSWAFRRARSMNAYAIDLKHIEQMTQEKLLGVIGSDGLWSTEIVFDFDKKEMELRPGGYKYADHGEKIQMPFHMVGHLAVVTIQVNGKRLRFGIDTGASVNVIHNRSAKALQSSLQTLPKEILIQDVNNKVRRAKCVSAENIAYQEAQLSATSFCVVDLDSLHDSSNINLDGLLGIPFLRQNNISIDFEKKIIYFSGN